VSLNVLIADDHAILRRGLKEILEEAPDIIVSGEAATGGETLNLIRQHAFDVLLLDITLPGISGIDVLKEIRRAGMKIPVLVLSIHSEDQYALRALKAGASGYLTKETAPDLLVSAIRKVADGGRYVSPALSERLALEISSGEDRSPHERLSDREFEVMQLIGAGKTIGEIAQSLALSVKTVSTYRARLLEKMNMRNNAELIRYVIENHLN